MPETTRDFTATTFVVDGDRTLLLFHKALQAWFPPGGHIHQDELPCDAAVREVREESGLEVELISPRVTLGRVEVLPQPECILLEQIAPDHQHIDLIYFARVVGGRLDVAPEESERHMWCGSRDLDGPEIAEDIRRLGRMAIDAVGKGQAPRPFPDG
ncbi:MAG: NUDIX domain-containing protein [Candidatus Latescibacteria bacterium]|jgi:ADP-ribose pyrophosphatase YjhB (NUDIX family)|nr:NUDIX domain-containing protein [Candidatus Latescibacterota bacterium]